MAQIINAIYEEGVLKPLVGRLCFVPLPNLPTLYFIWINCQNINHIGCNF
jgi:hypothetical protein